MFPVEFNESKMRKTSMPRSPLFLMN